MAICTHGRMILETTVGETDIELWLKSVLPSLASSHRPLPLELLEQRPSGRSCYPAVARRADGGGVRPEACGALALISCKRSSPTLLLRGVLSRCRGCAVRAVHLRRFAPLSIPLKQTTNTPSWTRGPIVSLRNPAPKQFDGWFCFTGHPRTCPHANSRQLPSG